MIPFEATTHPGLRREKNEDHFASDEALGLWVVADGVGGHSNGEVASEIACATIIEAVRRGLDLRNAIEEAHSAVLQEIQSRDAGNNMGTTVVALRVDDKHYEVAWVGDSRAYLYDGKLRQLTHDHSAVNDLLESGAITQDQAGNHPQRHALSRSLGVSATNASAVSMVSGTFRAGQQLLLCTDGLTDELSDEAITRELAQHDNLKDQVDALLSSALAHGGRDNLTFALVGNPRRKSRKDRDAPPDLAATQNISTPTGPAGGGRRLSGWIPLLALIVGCIVAALTLV